MKIIDLLNKILAKNTGKSLSKIIKDTERDNYLNAEDALKYGIVDERITLFSFDRRSCAVSAGDAYENHPWYEKKLDHEW